MKWSEWSRPDSVVINSLNANNSFVSCGFVTVHLGPVSCFFIAQALSI